MTRFAHALDRFADWLGLYLFEVAVNLMTPRRRVVVAAILSAKVREAYGVDTSAIAAVEPAE